MRRLPTEFQIPDDWWIEAGMADFSTALSAYRAEDGELIALEEIEPPWRSFSVPLSFRGFDRERMTAVLQGMAARSVLPPIPVLRLVAQDFSGLPYSYRVSDGFHRFYASVAAGFTHIPAIVREPML